MCEILTFLENKNNHMEDHQVCGFHSPVWVGKSQIFDMINDIKRIPVRVCLGENITELEKFALRIIKANI